MSTGYRLLAYLTLSCGLVYCNKQDRYDAIYLSDPYVASFWGKGIDYMLVDGGHGRVDTTFFDSTGNQVSVHFRGREYLKRAFDAAHRVRRLREYGEFFKNFVISYDTIQGDVVKKTEQLYSMDWDLEQDSSVRKVYYAVYKLDDLGRISSVIDTTLENSFISYRYENGLLVEKKERNRYEDAYRKGWLFIYNQRKLARIDFYFEDKLLSTDFFSDDGLIEYSVQWAFFEKPNDTTRYAFVYR